MHILRSPRSWLAAGLLLASMIGASACDTAAVPVSPGSIMSGGSGGSTAASTSSGASSSSGGIIPTSYWAKRFGSDSHQMGISIAVSPAGNVAVFGEITGPVDFGLGPLDRDDGISDLFVVVFDPGGHPIWNRNIRGRPQLGNFPGSLAFSGEDLVVAGTFSEQFPVNLAPQQVTSAGYLDVYVARFDPQGQTIWSRSFGNPKIQKTVDIVTDAHGNAYVTGEFDGPVDFGTGTFDFGYTSQNTSATRSVFLVKLGPAGDTVAATAINGRKASISANLAVDANEHVYLAGMIHGKADFGAGELVGDGFRLFVAAYDANLQPIYARKLEANVNDGIFTQTIVDVAADAAGTLAVSAWTDGPTDIDGDVLYGDGSQGAILVELDPAGKVLWDKPLGPQLYQPRLAFGPGSELLLTSAAEGSVDLGLGLLMVPEMSEALVTARYDATGKLLANRSMGGEATTIHIARLATNASGDMVIVGESGGPVDLGTGPLDSAAGRRLLVAQIPAP
jgi:hypothetical protein